MKGISFPSRIRETRESTVFGSLLMSAFGFIRFFTVPVRREEFIPLIKGTGMVSPKPVHEIIVRTQRGERVNVASDQRGEDAVGFQTGYPCGKGRGCKVHGDQKEKEDEGTEELRLVGCRPSGAGIKWFKKAHGSIRV